jgi:hypothetical protein
MKFDFKTEATITLLADEINSFFSIIDKISPEKDVVGFKSNKFNKKEISILENFNKIKSEIYVK